MKKIWNIRCHSLFSCGPHLLTEALRFTHNAPGAEFGLLEWT